MSERKSCCWIVTIVKNVMNDTLENNDKTVTPDDVNAALLNNGDDGNKYCCPSCSI